MKKIYTLLLASLLLAGNASMSAANRKVKDKFTGVKTFAIFIDSASAHNAAEELDMYAASVQTPKRAVETVVVSSEITPDSLRSIIRTMAARTRRPLEGMVFVGDIPVPMIQDAQHLTSAFKVDQTPRRMERSSCPSDRFYDDLALGFKFLGRDTVKTNLYYYSLLPDSPRRLAPTLYSGRIKPMSTVYGDKDENLRQYLRKVVEARKNPGQVGNMLMFAGHGYNSEDILARIDEAQTLKEQLPNLSRPGHQLRYLDFRNDEYAKIPLVAQLSRPDLSIALLHHHGAPDKEYIDRFPDARNVNEQLAQARLFFRGKIRDAVERGTPFDTVVARFCNNYDVPASWFNDLFDAASVAKDSVYYEMMDLHLGEFDSIVPSARVVVLDACFNGAFNHDRFMANAYIFNPGQTVGVIANSVNSLQDKWSDRNLALASLGMPLAEIVRLNGYLESHYFGDPTFSFAPSDADLEIPTKLLDMENDVNLSGDELLSIMQTSNSSALRMAAMMHIFERRLPQATQAVILGLSDGNEQIRRFAAINAGKIGDPQLLPAMLALYADNSRGKRVTFQLVNALQAFTEADIEKAIAANADMLAIGDPQLKEVKQMAKRSCYEGKRGDDVQLLAKDVNTLTKEERKDLRLFFRGLRNYPSHPAVEQLMAWLEQAPVDNPQVVDLLEAFGWYDQSYRRGEIAAALEAYLERDGLPETVATTALRSLNRLSD